MTSTIDPTEVVAQVARGRVRVSPERRVALLEQFDASGMSAARFADWGGVKYPAFVGWLQRRRRPGGRPAPDAAPPIGGWQGALVGGRDRSLKSRGVVGYRSAWRTGWVGGDASGTGHWEAR